MFRFYCLILSILTLASLLCFCGSSERRVSFLSLGYPEPPAKDGKGVIIIGWYKEPSDGWNIDKIFFDRTELKNWNQKSQQPIIIYKNPGNYKIRLKASQYKNGNLERRFTSSSELLNITEETSYICSIILNKKQNRYRPTFECERYEIEESIVSPDAGIDTELPDVSYADLRRDLIINFDGKLVSKNSDAGIKNQNDLIITRNLSDNEIIPPEGLGLEGEHYEKNLLERRVRILEDEIRQLKEEMNKNKTKSKIIRKLDYN